MTKAEILKREILSQYTNSFNVLNFKYFDIQIIWYDYIIDENFCKGILQGRNGNFPNKNTR